MRGSLLAGLGASLLFFSGIFAPEKILSRWGLIIFGISMLFIGMGLIPYRRLQRLELKPDEIRVFEDRTLHYFKKGQECFALPLADIQSVEWIDKGHIYGIGLRLKKVLPDLEETINRSQKKVGADLFLPFFSNRAYLELQELCQLDNTN